MDANNVELTWQKLIENGMSYLHVVTGKRCPNSLTPQQNWHIERTLALKRHMKVKEQLSTDQKILRHERIT